MKITVSAQKLRLEQALSTERKWSADRWKALFVKNPVMHQFAISLIWGVYEDDRLTDTFRYMEDGSFNTEEEDVYELPENASIGLVHPIELTEESREAWKQQLEDYEVCLLYTSSESTRRNRSDFPVRGSCILWIWRRLWIIYTPEKTERMCAEKAVTALPA